MTQPRVVRSSLPSGIARPGHSPSGCHTLCDSGWLGTRAQQAHSTQLRRTVGLGAPCRRCHTLRRSVPTWAQKPTRLMRMSWPRPCPSCAHLAGSRVRHRAQVLRPHSSRVSRAQVYWGAAGVPPRHATAPCRHTCAADASRAPIWPARTVPWCAEVFGVMYSTLRPPTARPLDEEPMRSSLQHTLVQRHAGEGRGSVEATEGAPYGPALSHLTARRRSVPSSRPHGRVHMFCDGWSPARRQSRTHGVHWQLHSTPATGVVNCLEWRRWVGNTQRFTVCVTKHREDLGGGVGVVWKGGGGAEARLVH